jgi:AcrR family transcriptional regulator
MGGTTVATAPVRRRADASRNRERIVSAARDALAETGPDVPLDEIARRAGVGNATLYRHFADRRELFRTVTLSVLDQAARRGEAAMAGEPDAFTALERFVHESVAARIGAQCTVLGMLDPREDAELDGAVRRLVGVVDGMLDAARDAGLLRADVGSGDLLLALSQLTRQPAGTACALPGHTVHRHLQVFLDGLRAPARSTLPGRAPTLEGLRSRA